MTLENKNVVITGGLKKMLRYQAYDLICKHGGNPKDNMSSIVDILVVADEMKNTYTTKIRKAPETITIISEATFYEMLGV